jgi:hypothetical protein
MESFNWTHGPLATSHLIKLSKTFREKVCKKISQITNIEYTQFSPWMTHFGRINQLQKLYTAPTPKGKLLTDSTTLNSLQLALSENQHLDLGISSELNIEINSHTQSEHPRLYDFVENTKQLLFRNCTWIETLFNHLIFTIIPLQDKTKTPFQRRVGFSSHLTKGAIYFLFDDKDDEEAMIRLSIDIAHELGHQCFMIYLNADRIILSPYDHKVYSPIKNEERTVVRCFHALFALAYMSIAAHLIKNDSQISDDGQSLATTILSNSLQDLNITTQNLKKHCDFSTLGNELIKEFESLVDCFK